MKSNWSSIVFEYKKYEKERLLKKLLDDKTINTSFDGPREMRKEGYRGKLIGSAGLEIILRKEC